jgi:hypothetical protein
VYHPKIIARNIHRALEAGEVYYELPVGDGRTQRRSFEPTFHSIAEVESSVGHLNGIIDLDSGKLKRSLDEAELAFIANERFLCRLDFDYYSQRYGKIVDQFDRKVSYSPRIPQKIIGDVLAEHELAQIAICIQALKARQLGFSRDISLRFGHRVIFYADVNAVLASADDDKSAKLARMMEYPIENLPWWLAPTPTARREGKFIEYRNQNSVISIESGRQFNGIARGTTPSLCHLSELSEFEDPETLVEASLLRAMHNSPAMFLVLESTAEGRGNWWHKKWLSSKEGYPHGRARLRPMFLPWYTGAYDLYPTDAWIRERQRHFDAWQPSDMVIRHAERCQAYVRSDQLLRRHLGADWELRRESMFFYEVEYEEHKRMGILNKFLSEMCCSDDEAFQSTNISVFDTQDIIWYRDETTREAPLGVYGLKTREDVFPARLQPAKRQIDPNQPKIDVSWVWGNSFPIHFTLEPLFWNGYGADDEEGLGKIFLYEMPDGHSTYGIGVDTGDGVGKDRSVCQVIRKGDPFNRPAQTAEFASPYVNSHDLWPIASCLASLFAMPQNGRLQQPRVAIECRGNGDTVQHEMLKRGFHNTHPWVRIDSKVIMPAKSQKQGVFTNFWFRKQMMDWLVKFLRDRMIDIHSPFLVKEMESLEADEFAQSLKAGYGEHDDRLMALGFIIVSMYQLEIVRGQRPEDIQLKEDEDPVWTPPDHGLGASRENLMAKLSRPAMTGTGKWR